MSGDGEGKIAQHHAQVTSAGDLLKHNIIAILSNGLQAVTAVVGLTQKHTAHPLGHFPATEMVLLNDAQVFGEDKIIENDEVLTCGVQAFKGGELCPYLHTRSAASRVLLIVTGGTEARYCLYSIGWYGQTFRSYEPGGSQARSFFHSRLRHRQTYGRVPRLHVCVGWGYGTSSLAPWAGECSSLSFFVCRLIFFLSNVLARQIFLNSFVQTVTMSVYPPPRFPTPIFNPLVSPLRGVCL